MKVSRTLKWSDINMAELDLTKLVTHFAQLFTARLIIVSNLLSRARRHMEINCGGKRPLSVVDKRW